MNHAVTTKEELLKTAEEIIKSEGVEKLSIRNLAGRRGIATGSVYNYFPSKNELMVEVMENFWRRVFHSGVCHMPKDQSFPELVEHVYGKLYHSLPEFQALFGEGLRLLDEEARLKGKRMEQKSMTHMKQAFLSFLMCDKKVPPRVWTDVFTGEKYVEFVFGSMFQMLINGEQDCSFLLELIKRTIYVS